MKNLLLMLLVVVGLYACNQTGSGGVTTTNSNGTTALKKVKSNCTNPEALECKPGMIFVKNAEELMQTGKILEDFGQQKDSAQFSNNHFAVLVAPNEYVMKEGNNPRAFNLGYNTQVLGVGKSMNDVIINPGIEAYNNPDDNDNCFIHPGNTKCLTVGGLNNFWRGIENFTVARPNSGGAPLIFAVSQASPIRSVNFKDTNVLLCDWHAQDPVTHEFTCGYTSGGFIANSIIDKTFIPGSQQQWLARNTRFLSIPEVAVWNSIFVGVDSPGDPVGKAPYPGFTGNGWDNFPVTYNPFTPSDSKTREKPFLACAGDCKNEALGDIKWKVEVPQTRAYHTGIDDFNAFPPKEIDVNPDNFVILSVDAEGVVKTLGKTEIDAINLAIASGKNLIITPGVYNLDGGSINITRDDTIVLGLGLPSLVCTGTAQDHPGCINISARSGVDLAGVTLDAGYNKTPSLLQVGPVGHVSSAGDKENPIVLHDVYFRIAETQLKNPVQERQTEAAVIINTSYVLGDNLWVWRADHDFRATKSITWGQDLAKYGLIVYGDNVTINGLAVEHFQDYQTVWYGKNGTVNFYQSEMPYDVPSLDSWQCSDPISGKVSPVRGCASYVVESAATGHTANGLGVYTYFRDASVMAKSGYIVPEKIHGSGISLSHLMGKWLNGIKGPDIPLTTNGYTNLVATPEADKCLGKGVSFTSRDDVSSEYSVEGVVDNDLTKLCKLD
ncbi:MAG: hypothetical protein K0R14_259 [Burkholderiales bacterium]|jgi:hypothetical protein|nr:hypothetical protein [Burkholderiales bacterium]